VFVHPLLIRRGCSLLNRTLLRWNGIHETTRPLTAAHTIASRKLERNAGRRTTICDNGLGDQLQTMVYRSAVLTRHRCMDLQRCKLIHSDNFNSMISCFVHHISSHSTAYIASTACTACTACTAPLHFYTAATQLHRRHSSTLQHSSNVYTPRSYPFTPTSV
jgi:hypothetical protein